MAGFQDPYCYPGTHILRSHFDVRDEKTLRAIETELTNASIIRLRNNPEPGDYDLAHLARMHGRIFGDVYPWAGEIRRVDIGKGSTQFMPHTLIPRGADFLFNRIREQNFLRGLDRRAFIAAAAENLADLNHLHPFAKVTAERSER